MPETAKKPVTMLDVARSISVSKATVSLAYTGNGRIAPETRDMVLRAAREMGFEPNPHAQRLKARTSNLIGLFTIGLDLTIGTEKIQYLQYHLSERGYEVPLYSVALGASGARTNEIELISTLRRQKPRAIVCSNANLRPEVVDELKNYIAEGGVVVCYDRQSTGALKELECDVVVFDREDETYQGVRHLLELGHRQIGSINHGQRDAANPRTRGFERALREYGQTVRDEWILCGGDYRSGAANLAQRFLELSDRPTGVYIVNDLVAAVFINQVQRAGLRVPEDVSVVGHGGRPFSEFSAVPLTTTTHPVEEIGEATAQQLLRRLQGDDSEPRVIEVRAQLIVRQSSGAPHLCGGA